MGLVEEAVRNWETERAGVIAELENIPEEDFEYRPTAEARSLRELALHLAEAGLILGAELLRTDGSFLRLFAPGADFARPAARSKAEILELLRTSGVETTARLRTAGEGLAAETIQTFHGIESRLSALWFVVGHEMYHCGQIASYARAVGRVPALTQRLGAILSEGASEADRSGPVAHR